MARILIVEDETDLAELLEYNLKSDGHEPTHARTGAQGLSLARTSKFDLVLLDLMLPDVGGAEVARMLKAGPETRRLPIIMVTAKADEADRVRGLALGADDYVVKPFSVQELLLRVKAVLRRNGGDDDGPHRLSHGPIVLDSDRHEVTVDGAVIALTALEFRLLKLFLSRPGRVQTRETLLADVWGIEADITTRTVDTHIKRLREKLGPAGDRIETIRGVGYKLEAPA